MDIWVIIFVFGVLLMVWIDFVGFVIIIDYFGNKVYDNGMIDWGFVFFGIKYKIINIYSDGGLGMLFVFVRSFVNII